MKKQVVSTQKAPAAIGPYSQATIGKDTVYVSGQLPLDAATSEMPESIEEQVAQSMKNVIALVEEAGSSVGNILRCGIFVTDMKLFPRVNEAYAKFFTEAPPARFVVEVSGLPKGAQVEIEAIALL